MALPCQIPGGATYSESVGLKIDERDVTQTYSDLYTIYCSPDVVLHLVVWVKLVGVAGRQPTVNPARAGRFPHANFDPEWNVAESAERGTTRTVGGSPSLAACLPPT